MAYTEGLLMAPSVLRQHVFPWLERVGALCRAHDLPYVFHSDGCLYEVIDDLLACGINALHPIEPLAMDIIRLKRQYAGRLCFMGNVALDRTLVPGTPADVRQEVGEKLQQLATGGGDCLGSSNSIPDYVPVENYLAMLRAASDFQSQRSWSMVRLPKLPPD